MSTERIAFPDAAHRELAVATTSGKVIVVGEERGDIAVEGVRRDRVGFRQGLHVGPEGRIDIVPARRSDKVEIRCPVGADVIVGTTSGNVRLEGRLGNVRVTTVSASVSVEEVDGLDVRGVSGTVEVERCHGRCRVRGTSGSVSIERTGSVEIGTVSGNVDVERLEGEARVKTVSASIEIGAEGAGEIDIHTVSGSVTVTLPATVRPRLRLKTLGRVRSELEEGNDCRIAVKSVSGSITVAEG